MSKLNIVYDEKCQVLEGISGHAGVFSTTIDLLNLQHLISSLMFDNNSLYKEIIRPRNIDQNSITNKMAMTYIHHPRGLEVTEVVPYASLNSLASAGFTGTWALYDPVNGFTTNFLTNPLSSEKGKPKDYVYQMDEYKNVLINLAFYLKVYERYLEKTKSLRDLDIQKVAIKKL